MRRILTLIALLSLVLACRSVDIQMRDYKPDQPPHGGWEDPPPWTCPDITTSLRIWQPHGFFSRMLLGNRGKKDECDKAATVLVATYIALPLDLISLNGPDSDFSRTTFTCNFALPKRRTEPVRPEEARKPIETVETFTPIASVHQSNSRMITIVHPGHVLRTGETLYVDDANGQRIAITVIRVFHTKSECTATQDVRIQPGARVYRATRTPIDREGQDR